MSSRGVDIGEPNGDCPPPNNDYARRDTESRLHIVNAWIDELQFKGVKAVSVPDSGYIEVTIPKSWTAAARGKKLAELEEKLQEQFGGVYVMVQPAQDKNRLRKLRGVQVK